MKKLVVFSALSLPVLAFAQNAFEGFYGQIGVGYESVTASEKGSTYTSTGGTTSPLNRSFSDSDKFTGSVTLGYTMPLADSFTVGVGAEYYALSSQNANYTYTVTGVTSGTGNWKRKSAYNIFVSPGFVISKDSLVYAKIGYAGADAQSNVTGSAPSTISHHGYSLGLGYKQMIDSNLYGFAEANYFNYGDKTATTVSNGTSTTKTGLTSYNFLVGVGYRF